MTLLALIFVFGAWVLQQLPVLPSLYWACLLVVPAILVISGRRSSGQFSRVCHRQGLAWAAFLLGFFWAAAFATHRLADALPTEWERQDIQIVGVVASLPQAHENGQRFEFDVEQVITAGAVVPRHLALSYYHREFAQSPEPGEAALPPPYKAGQRWQLTVRVKRPHGTINPHGFDFEAWSLERNIRASGYVKKHAGNRLLTAAVYRPGYMVEILRERIRERMDRVLQNKPYKGVLQALAIGDESGITQDDWQTFLETGTNHLMSISGLHITMLAGLGFTLVHFLWRRSAQLTLALPARKAAALAGALVALAYALIAGFSIPTQRTLYMLGVFAFALWSDRQLSIFRVLAYALFVVVLLDPWAVLAAGFWLSFGAVAVIAYALGGRLQRPHWFSAAITTQWAVTIGLLPLLLVMFQQASIISPVANALAIPLISLVVVPLTLLGCVVPVDSLLVLAHQVMNLCMRVLIWLTSSGLSVWQQQAPPLWTLPLALAGVLWLLLPRGFPLRALGVVALLPMLMPQPIRPATGAMQVAVLDVGQGLAVLVTTETHAMLYDSGPVYSSSNDSGNRIIVPYLRAAGIRHLDGMLISHDDNDHSGGAASILRAMPVAQLYSSLPDGHPLILAYMEANTQQQANPPVHQRCHVGQSWQWDGVRFEMLHPAEADHETARKSDNDKSCVLRVTSRYGRLLIAGDIERDAENTLLDSEYALNSDVLIAPHHGSKTSSSSAFVEAVNPAAVIFTSGYHNKFRHPHPKVVERFEAAGSKIYRSDQDGAVLIDFDPESGVRLTSWREQNKRYWHQDFGRVSGSHPAASLLKTASHAKVATL